MKGQQELNLEPKFLILSNLNVFLGSIHLEEPEDPKPNNDESEEEYVAVDGEDEDDDIESKKDAMITFNSSNKRQFANFSVLSLLARKCPDKEKEKKSPVEIFTKKEILFPSSGEDVAKERVKTDEAEQSAQVGKGIL